MSRKIVSQLSDAIQGFKPLDPPLPTERLLEEDLTVTLQDGREFTVHAGEKDPNFPTLADLETVFLVRIGDRRYDSVHQNYTDKLLEPDEDHDYVIETKLDANFTNTVLLHNSELESKFKKDPSILATLGLPSFDPTKIYKDLHAELTVNKEAIAAAKIAEDLETARIEAFQKSLENPTPSTEDKQKNAEDLAKSSEGQAITETPEQE